MLEVSYPVQETKYILTHAVFFIGATVKLSQQYMELKTTGCWPEKAFHCRMWKNFFIQQINAKRCTIFLRK